MAPSDTLWLADWLWSLPLIALCVVLHVIGLSIINRWVVDALQAGPDGRHFLRRFGLVIGVAVLLASLLHGAEAWLWALAYWQLGALPELRSAMLYSLGAMTTYGHTNIDLFAEWRMMGALEALNGMLLFGLTTAFLFAVIQKVWPLGERTGRPRRPAQAKEDRDASHR